MFRTRSTTLLLLAFAGLPALAFSEAGYTSANFLQIGEGARAAALADSFTALSDDATAVFWNPAGIDQAQGTQFSLTHTQWLQNVDIETLALSQNLGAEGGIGLGFSVLSLQSFLSTLEDSTGTYSGTGPSVNAGDWELTGGYSNLLGRIIPDTLLDHTLVGIGVNVLGQTAAGPVGTAFSFNAGVIQLFPKEHFTLGLDIVNLGTNIDSRDLPLDLKAGASWHTFRLMNKNDKLTIAADTDVYSDTGFQPRLGSEYRLPLDSSNVGFLRAGLRTTDNQFGFSFLALGAGLEHAFSDLIVNLDYAFVPYGTIGPTHRITLGLRLGNQEKTITAELTGPPRFDLKNPVVNLDLKSHADDPVESWTLELADSKGQLVKEIKGTGEPPASYAWNGQNSSGLLVPAGTYGAILKVVDVEGRTALTSPVSFLAVAPLTLDNVQWTLSSDTTFDVASAVIVEKGKEKLTIVGDGLIKYFGEVQVEISGHTDNSPCRVGPHCKFSNNQDLSEARAQAVKDLFIGLGIKPENVVIKGFADTVPVADNATIEGRSKNRRIEIKIRSVRTETIESISNAGIFLMNIGQPDQALQIFKLVTDHDPDKPEAYVYMADCYTKMGDLGDARSAFSQAQKLGWKPPPTAPDTDTESEPSSATSPLPTPQTSAAPVPAAPSVATPIITPSSVVTPSLQGLSPAPSLALTPAATPEPSVTPTPSNQEAPSTVPVPSPVASQTP